MLWFKFLHSHSEEPFGNDPEPNSGSNDNKSDKPQRKDEQRKSSHRFGNLEPNLSIISIKEPIYRAPRSQSDMISELMKMGILHEVTSDSLTDRLDLHYFEKFGRRRFIRNVFISEKEIIDAKKWIFRMYLWVFTTVRRLPNRDNNNNNNSKNKAKTKMKSKNDEFLQYRCEFDIGIKEIRQIENTILSNTNINSKKCRSTTSMSYFPTNEYPTPVKCFRESSEIRDAKRRENDSLKRVALKKFPSKIFGINCDKKTMKHIGDYLNSVFSSITLLQEPWFWKNFSINLRHNLAEPKNKEKNDNKKSDLRSNDETLVNNSMETTATMGIYSNPSKIDSEMCYNNGSYTQYALFHPLLIELIQYLANTTYKALTYQASKEGSISITRLIEFKKDLKMFEFHTCYIVCRPLPSFDFFNHWALKFEGNHSLLTIGFFDSFRKNQSGKVRAELRINGPNLPNQRRIFWYYWPLEYDEKLYFTQSWKVIDKIDLLDCNINQIYDSGDATNNAFGRVEPSRTTTTNLHANYHHTYHRNHHTRSHSHQLFHQSQKSNRMHHNSHNKQSQRKSNKYDCVYKSPRNGKVIGSRGVTAAEIGAIVEAWLTCRLGEYAEYKLGHNNCQHFARDIVACFSTTKAMSLNTLMDHKMVVGWVPGLPLVDSAGETIRTQQIRLVLRQRLIDFRQEQRQRKQDLEKMVKEAKSMDDINLLCQSKKEEEKNGNQLNDEKKDKETGTNVMSNKFGFFTYGAKKAKEKSEKEEEKQIIVISSPYGVFGKESNDIAINESQLPFSMIEEECESKVKRMSDEKDESSSDDSDSDSDSSHSDSNSNDDSSEDDSSEDDSSDDSSEDSSQESDENGESEDSSECSGNSSEKRKSKNTIEKKTNESNGGMANSSNKDDDNSENNKKNEKDNSKENENFDEKASETSHGFSLNESIVTTKERSASQTSCKSLVVMQDGTIIDSNHENYTQTHKTKRIIVRNITVPSGNDNEDSNKNDNNDKNDKKQENKNGNIPFGDLKDIIEKAYTVETRENETIITKSEKGVINIFNVHVNYHTQAPSDKKRHKRNKNKTKKHKKYKRKESSDSVKTQPPCQ